MKRDMNTLSFNLKPDSLFYVHCTIFHEVFSKTSKLEELMKVRFHPMKSTKSSLVILSKKSAIDLRCSMDRPLALRGHVTNASLNLTDAEN